MATRRQSLNVTIDLSHVHCIDEGDGPGDAEPYLWTLFFKIDGQTVVLDALNMKGVITVDRRNGSHGNLQNTDVEADDDVAIPPSLGRWDTVLVPIPLTVPLEIKNAAGQITETM